jgi:hypothetical protein
MLMGWDYISELQAQRGLLFIPQVIYEHGKPWWNDNDREKLLIHPLELSGNFTRSHLVAKQEEHDDGNAKLCLQSISFILMGFLCCEILCHGTDSYTHELKEVKLWIFSTLKSPLVPGWFEAANLGSSGKHAATRLPRATRTSLSHVCKILYSFL